MPPREIWTPGEEAIYRPVDPYRIPLDEALATQLKAVKHAFTRQYTLNGFYRTYCDENGVTPDDLKTTDDLEKVPLIPDLTFKTHPSGKDLAYWIAGLFTGDLPEITLENPDPTLDDVLNAFNAKGLAFVYSSGTSGRHTMIPRDMRTSISFVYSFAKTRVGLFNDDPDHQLSLIPKPTSTNLLAGRILSFQSKLYRDEQFALELEITADKVAKAMTADQSTAAPPSVYAVTQKLLENSIAWLERYDKTSDTITLYSAPGIYAALMDLLEGQGKRYDFGERGTLLTGGGWSKTGGGGRISPEGFRKRVGKVLGIPETHCLEAYAMTEGNAVAMSCPEGHYYHLPYATFKPLVLDDNLDPAGYDERGRFAFLDPLAYSYPGFIITGDEVKMYQRCPVCDRPGPVLDPDIHRAKGEEVRGCANVVQRVLEQELSEGAR
ncbi:MAG: LuxE/PaaK family acyltransferase [Halobacteriota archaeon]